MKVFPLKKKDCRGMTLVEVLVVTAILGIVIMAVMSLFIPAVKSTAVQTDLSDVQSNLRMAMNRLTDDLLTAGFLMGTEEPIISKTSTAFTIQTRAIGSGFARIISAAPPVVTLGEGEMIEAFPDGSKVRLFNPMTASEIDVITTPLASDRVYTANHISGEDDKLSIDSGGVLTTIDAETVIVRVKDDTVLPIQTICYRLSTLADDGTNDTLIRTVNGNDQFLARGISAINFSYIPDTGKVRRVDITITGETQDRGNDILSEVKTRTLRSSVTLRNVF